MYNLKDYISLAGLVQSSTDVYRNKILTFAVEDNNRIVDICQLKVIDLNNRYWQCSEDNEDLHEALERDNLP